MVKNLLVTEYIKEYFQGRGYNCVKPYNIVNNNDTVFVTAGIQPLLYEYRNLNFDNASKIYLSQPVIRTQFANTVAEGYSIAFTNSTTCGFNISEENHNNLVKDWIELFCELGMSRDCIFEKSKSYEREWGDLLVSGKKTFYYYNDLELGDTTFFTSITKNGDNIGIDTMSDVGFGLERIRWCISGKSYFDLYSDSSLLSPEVKANLSVVALMAVNGVKPSNKNCGYRARMFSKRLAELLEGRSFSRLEENYLMECVEYWKQWQEVTSDVDVSIIRNEYDRNCNRYIIEQLTNDGYQNLSGININISKEELGKRLICANVEKEKVKRLIR